MIERSADSVQRDWSRRGEEHLLSVGVELACRKTSAGRELAHSVRKPVGQLRDVVEREQMAVARRDEQIALFSW